MTTLCGDSGKKIQFSISNVIREIDRDTYVVELPMVICDNIKDAELIQDEVSSFVSKLSKTIIKK